MSVSVGSRLAHYDVQEHIGSGGMGDVYRAKDTKLGRDVAIKVLPDRFANDPERLTRFRHEAQVLASLNHPNIAAIHGLEETRERSFLVLELVPGETLRERLTMGEHQQTSHSWSPDGQSIAFTDTDPKTGGDIWILPLFGDRKPRPFLRTPAGEGGAKFSADGRWITYASNESGRYEVYVQPFPGPGGKWQISTDGGVEPMWVRTGELFYWKGNRLMAVETKTDPTFSAGAPRLVFEGVYERSGLPAANYAVTSDGQRFLLIKSASQQAGAVQINLVLNWFEELKQRMTSPK